MSLNRSGFSHSCRNHNISFSNQHYPHSLSHGFKQRRRVSNARTSKNWKFQPHKEINKFYSCISKTHQDPPSIEKVDNCYSQTLSGSGGDGVDSTTGSITTSSTSPTSASGSASHHHKQ